MPKRRVVERSNSWTMRARRNVRDHERNISHAEAHIRWAFITFMSRRLAGHTGSPSSRRRPPHK
jgi:hypothetical protein